MSAYITKSDYLTEMRAASLDKLTDDTDDILNAAEETAISMVKSYIGKIYDFEAEIAKIGLDRDYMTLKIVKDITIANIFERIHVRKRPDHIVENYDRAIDWLEKVARGEIDCNLDAIQDNQGNDVLKFRWGSATKRTH